jgi:hypothetical protein
MADKKTEREVKERAKREAKEAKEKAKRRAEKAKEAKKKSKKVVVSTEGAELYQGIVTLKIAPPVDFRQLDSLKGSLVEVEDLRVIMVVGGVGEDSRVFVSAAEPLPLLDILRGIPVVGGVVGRGSEIEVSLKTA